LVTTLREDIQYVAFKKYLDHFYLDFQ
jgi:hypothetical protein